MNKTHTVAVKEQGLKLVFPDSQAKELTFDEGNKITGNIPHYV